MWDYATDLKTRGAIAEIEYEERLKNHPMGSCNEFAGFPKIKALEEKYLPQDEVKKNTKRRAGTERPTAMRRALLIPVACLAATTLAADYPSKPIRLIVPLSPGGGTDIFARMLGAQTAPSAGRSRWWSTTAPAPAATSSAPISSPRRRPTAIRMLMRVEHAHDQPSLRARSCRSIRGSDFAAGHAWYRAARRARRASVAAGYDRAATSSRWPRRNPASSIIHPAATARARTSAPRAVEEHGRHRSRARRLQGRRAGDAGAGGGEVGASFGSRRRPCRLRPRATSGRWR